ncbi:hypothetical protein PMIN06_002306 [Paraphaeosphaeria minitans]
MASLLFDTPARRLPHARLPHSATTQVHSKFTSASEYAAQTLAAPANPAKHTAESQARDRLPNRHLVPQTLPTTLHAASSTGICIRAKGTLSDSTLRPSCNHFAVRGNLAASTTAPTARPLHDVLTSSRPQPTLHPPKVCIYCMSFSALKNTRSVPIAVRPLPQK